MSARFRQKETSEYKVFADRPAQLWTGGNSPLSSADFEFVRDAEPSYFIFDCEEPGNRSYFWQPKIEEGDQLFLRSLMAIALDYSKHIIVILADPRLLSAALADPEHEASVRKQVDSRAGNLPAWASYRRHLGRVFVGCRVNKETISRPEAALPWLSTVPFVSRFVWVDGDLPEDCKLEDLRPCGDEVPYAGDYNLFTGEVYWAGTYLYRDSQNAFQRRLNPLSFVIVDVAGFGEKLPRSVDRVIDECVQYEVPLAILGASEKQRKFWEDDEFPVIVSSIIKEISKDEAKAA